MGETVFAAKMNHVPTLLMSEQERPPTIDGHYEIARCAKEPGATTVIICDTHCVINTGFHINANAQ